MSNVFDKTTDGDYTFTLGLDKVTNGRDILANGRWTLADSPDADPCFIIFDQKNLSTKRKHDKFCRIKNLYLFRQKEKN